MLRSTYTLAELQLSPAAYDEIAAKLREAGYNHVFIENGMIDMSEIGITRQDAKPEPVDEALVSCILRYGGRCRECADNFGICEGSALPCEPAEARRAVRHVLSAKTYYDQHPEFVEEARKFL